VILLGDGEWDGLLQWLQAHALADGRISSEDLQVLHQVSQPEAVCPIVDAARERQRCYARGQRPRSSPSVS
jgi:predicted Rossmann-fold nucleotide-binding protein